MVTDESAGSFFSLPSDIDSDEPFLKRLVSSEEDHPDLCAVSD